MLRAIVEGSGTPEIALEPAPTASFTRSVTPGLFVADPVPAGAHVVVVDDTWVSGGHAQSAVLAVRAAGAARVSVLALARWLDVSRTETAPHLSSLSGPDFNPRQCPWTGSACPK